MGTISVLLLVALIGSPAPIAVEIEKALEAFALGDFDGALVILNRAEIAAPNKMLKAKTIYHQGVILEAMGEKTDALIAFARAVSIDPAIEVKVIEVKNSVIHLFRCGQALARFGYGVNQIRARIKTDEDLLHCLAKLEAEAPTRADPPPLAPKLELDAPAPPSKVATAPPAKKTAVLPWVLMGVGGVSTVVGLYFGWEAEAYAKVSKENSHGAQRAIETTEDFARIANIGFGVGAASSAAGLILWLMSGNDSDVGQKVGIVPNRNGAAICWEGRF